MFNPEYTFIWTFVNLMALFLILRKILFKRVGDFMKNRSEGIASNIAQGEAAKAEGEAYRKQAKEALDNAAAERRTMLEEARKRSQNEYEAIIAEARSEAKHILESARQEIDRERKEMVSELEGKVASLAIMAATKVVETNMDTKANAALVDKFIKGEGAA